MHFLDIGELSEKTGMRPSALRYYEQVGLIHSVARHGLRRQFPPEALLQLKLIAMGKAAGFSLAEMSGMFGRNGATDLPRAALRDKADQLDDQIRELTLLRDTVRHIADCPAPTHLECPKFRRLLDAGVGPRAKPAAKPGPTKARSAAASID
jgi:DNA-binding transcriptional MerR regulator